MFIISCDKDNSYCEVPDDKVIFDNKNPPKKGECVNFFWNRTKYTGKVILKSGKCKIYLHVFLNFSATTTVILVFFKSLFLIFKN